MSKCPLTTCGLPCELALLDDSEGPWCLAHGHILAAPANEAALRAEATADQRSGRRATYHASGFKPRKEKTP